MDIGIVTHDFDPGEGHGRYTVKLVQRLATRHRVTVYAANAAHPVPEGVRLTRVPVPTRPAYATILLFPTAVRRLLSQHDVLHAQGLSVTRADVVTAHIVLGAWRAAIRNAGVTPGTGERLFGALTERRERSLYRRGATHVVAPSQRVCADLARHYGRTEHVHVIPHGFPSEAATWSREAARRRLGLPERAFIALYAGDARKGLDMAAQAAAAVDGAHLMVVTRSRPQALAGLPGGERGGDRLHWIGTLPDLAPAYAAADALLHPSLYDAFGLVVAEAMSAGVPVVVSDACGIADLIQHQVSGWLVRPREPSDAAAALTALRDDADLRDRLAAAARRVAASRTWDQVTLETERVYEEAAARR